MFCNPKGPFRPASLPRLIPRPPAIRLFPALLALAIPFAGPRPAPAQAPEITIEGQSGVPIAIVPIRGNGGEQISRTLQSDLTNSGVFRFASSGRGAFVAEGGVTGSALNGRLLDPTGRPVLTRTYRTGNPVTDAHLYADDIVLTVTGKPGIASSRIVFVSNRSGHKELYLCEYDGSNVRQITRDNAISASPSISPDASKIAYTSYRSGYPDIYVIDLRSGSRNRIISSPGTNSGAAISPNGNKIALTMSFAGNPELYVTSMRGGGARRLTFSRNVEASPSWFPDGDRILFTSDQSGSPQIYESTAAGRGLSLIKTGYGFCTEPSVAPDGTKMAFNARISGSMVVGVYEFRTGAAKVISSGGSAEDPCWGADSRHLIYSKNGSLYRHDTTTGNTAVVLSGMGRISEPSWSR